MTKTRDGAVVSLSGGMDSTTLLKWAIDKYGKGNVHAVLFNYGQKHKTELDQAMLICAWLEVSFDLLQLPLIFAGAGSTLVDASTQVEIVGSYEELAARYGSQPTVVPNRNMNFLAMATTIALTKGLNRVLIGAHAGDAANYHYPDCRPAFNGAMAAAIDLATEGQVSLEAPFNWMDKGEIVSLAYRILAPLELSQSCYNGRRPACGKCATCLERINAFNEAGFYDPIDYEGFHPQQYAYDTHQIKAFPVVNIPRGERVE